MVCQRGVLSHRMNWREAHWSILCITDPSVKSAARPPATSLSSRRLMRPGDLPDFELPPVVEVAIGVQFSPLAEFRSKHLALLWERWRTDCPVWEDQAPIPPTKEWFGAPGPFQPDVRFEFGPPPLRRALFSDEGGTELRQVQSDRFVGNWRKLGDPYPRYDDADGNAVLGLRSRFRADLEFVAAFIAEHQLGTLKPNQCEVTYVNHIPRTGPAGAATLEDVVAPWRGEWSDDFLPEPEAIELAIRYLLTEGGRNVGRLHVAAMPARDQATGELLTRLTLTAHGVPIGEGIDGVMAFLDLGRRYIVKGFASLTTEAMHRKWRRKHDG